MMRGEPQIAGRLHFSQDRYYIVWKVEKQTIRSFFPVANLFHWPDPGHSGRIIGRACLN